MNGSVPHATDRTTRGLPLEGLRVIDLAWSWAGPLATRLLADMGAEVVKIESADFPDWTRVLLLADSDAGNKPWDRGGYFHKLNRNKLGIALDLDTPEGARIFKELVAIGDVVIEAFSPRVMGNLGLDYAALTKVKPDIIMLSLSGFGQTGPWRNYLAYGISIEAIAGLVELTGYAGGPPRQTGLYYGDPIAGLTAAGAILTALAYRRRTGKGQYIDLSMREALMPLIGEAIADFAMNGRIQGRTGNRHPHMAPHGVYPCKGNDSWVAIAVASDADWARFCEIVGNAELRESRFCDAVARLTNQEELDRIVGQWTVSRDGYEVMRLLQGTGIACGLVLSGEDLLNEPHLRARRFFQLVEHPGVGPRLFPGIPFKLSATPGTMRMPAPCFAEHNQYVLSNYLGKCETEIASLIERGVLQTSPSAASRASATTARGMADSVETSRKLGHVVSAGDDYRNIGGCP